MEQSEYEVQLFGFSAAQVTLERKHIFKTLLMEALENILRKATTNEETSRLLHEKKELVLQNILESLKENFQAFQELDRKHFNIPGHVLLECDFEHAKEYTEETEKQLDEEIASLERIYLENAVMKAALESEEEKFEAIKPYIMEALEIQVQLENCLRVLEDQFTYIDDTKMFLDALSEKRE